MTEADWRATTDVDAMLQFLDKRWTRLGFDPEPFHTFAAACAHRVRQFLAEDVRAVADQLHGPRPTSRDRNTSSPWEIYTREYFDLCLRVSDELPDVGRGAADGRAAGELFVRWYATLAAGYGEVSPPYIEVIRNAALAVELADRLADYPPGVPVPLSVVGLDVPFSVAERAVQADLVRCVFGNPFRPVAFEAAWRTETVVALARGMDEARDFAALPVLADALEDAGCADAELLAHCRGAGPHARGCHAIDHVLGRW